jgi:hypothetical protein
MPSKRATVLQIIPGNFFFSKKIRGGLFLLFGYYKKIPGKFFSEIILL